MNTIVLAGSVVIHGESPIVVPPNVMPLKEVSDNQSPLSSLGAIVSHRISVIHAGTNAISYTSVLGHIISGKKSLSNAPVV